MKFVLAFVALAMVAAVNAAPGTFFGSTLGLEALESIQVNAKKLKLAGADLEVDEGKLAALSAESQTIADATALLIAAVETKASTYGMDVYEHET